MKKKKMIIAFLICFILVISIGFGMVRTDSMEPSIKNGSIIIYLKIFDRDSLKPGDIVLFRDAENRMICHRIIEINEDIVVTKGDALPESDPFIYKKSIIAKLIFKF